MRPPRPTIRNLMCVVVAVGIILHVMLATMRVGRARTYHAHTWVHIQAGKPILSIGSLQAPFWPRYWRSLLGLPSEKLPLCRPVEGRLLDACEYAHPEIIGVNRTNPTPAQLDLFRRLASQ